MIVAFFGHADFKETPLMREQMLFLLEKEIDRSPAVFYLGGYGAFDEFARLRAKEYQKKHADASLVLVTPYITLSHQKNHISLQKARYDEVLYPPLEKVPLRYAISHRNRYIAAQADLIIAFVKHDWGGAYQACRMAKRMGKRMINLAAYEIK